MLEVSESGVREFWGFIGLMMLIGFVVGLFISPIAFPKPIETITEFVDNNVFSCPPNMEKIGLVEFGKEYLPFDQSPENIKDINIFNEKTQVGTVCSQGNGLIICVDVKPMPEWGWTCRDVNLIKNAGSGS